MLATKAPPAYVCNSEVLQNREFEQSLFSVLRRLSVLLLSTPPITHMTVRTFKLGWTLSLLVAYIGLRVALSDHFRAGFLIYLTSVLVLALVIFRTYSLTSHRPKAVNATALFVFLSLLVPLITTVLFPLIVLADLKRPHLRSDAAGGR